MLLGISAARRGAGRYDVLLLGVAVTVLLSPLDRSGWRPVVAAALLACFFFAVWTSGARQIVLGFVAVLAMLAVSAAVFASVSHGPSGRVLFAATEAVLCATTVGVLVARLSRRLQVTTRTLAASLAIYLLVGLLFATLYGLIGAMRDDGFFVQHIGADGVAYMYFSFITLTTLGYGDLTPVTDLGRVLAAGEAVLGQLYLVTVVAIVVNNRHRS